MADKEDELDKPPTIGSLRDRAARVPVGRLFDVIDATLDVLDANKELDAKRFRNDLRISRNLEHSAAMRAHLATLLDNALSKYQIRPDGHGLERRDDVISKAAAEEAAAAGSKAEAGSSATHLRRAWHVLHALHPEPGIAYSESVKAVEAAAHAVLDPGNPRATLGTMIRTLRDHPRQFALVIAGPDGTGSIAPLIANMKLLWEGQTSRHGSQSTTREETLDEATMAVSVAVLLVGWFAGGAVKRRTS